MDQEVSIFSRWITTFPTTLVKEAVFSPLDIFSAFVKNKVGIAVWIHPDPLFCSTGPEDPFKL
jgi:hypothetical protein